MELDALRKLLHLTPFSVFENYEQYLRFASRFYNYDVNNVLLTFKQYPTATQIAGYHAWKNQFHATVPSNTPAIALLIPAVQISSITVDVVDEFGEPEYDAQNRIKKEREDAASLTFKPAYVFDVSQVKLDHDVMSATSTPNLQDFPRIFRTNTKFTLSFVNANDADTIPRHKNYLLNAEDRDLILREDLSPEEAAAACIRAYSELLVKGNTTTFSDGRLMSDFAAQAIAYIANLHFGLSVANFSFTYAQTFLDEAAETLHYFLWMIQENAFLVIQTFSAFAYSFNEINLLNNLLTTPSKETFLDNLEEIIDNTDDSILLSDIHSLRNKVDMLTAEQFTDLYQVRNNRQLWSQPIKYVVQP